MTRISLVRAVILAGLVAGCTVVYPNGTAVITNNNTAGAASPEPWPSRTPAANRFSEAPPPTGARSFAGKGPNMWVGPLVLPAGRTSLTVRFTAAIEPGGEFLVTLRNSNGQFVGAVIAHEGTFEATQSINVERDDTYYLAVEAADGDWDVKVDAR